jgi:hypothetical protein
MRSFAFVLLRRFLFRPLSQPQPIQINSNQALHQTLYDHLSTDALSAIGNLLLHSFSNEPTPAVRQASAETITAFANYSNKKGRPWYALQVQIDLMTQHQNMALRASAFRVLAETDMRGMGVQTEDMLRVLQRGLEDRESIDVGFLLFSLFRSECLVVPFFTPRSVSSLYVVQKTIY